MNSLRGPSGFSDNLQPSVPPGHAAPSVRPLPANEPGQMFFHFDFRRSLQLYWGLALGVFLLAVLAAVGYGIKGWHKYLAEAIIYVQPAPQNVIDHGQTSRWPNDANTYDSYIQQQVHNITRRDVLVAAVPRVKGWQRSGESLQAAADRLGRALVVDRIGTTYQISLEAKGKTAQGAADIANAVAASFLASATREMRSGDTQRLELLREERDRVMKELASDRAEQDDLNKKVGVASLSSVVPDPIDEQMNALRAELVRARVENDQAAARLTSLNKGGAGALTAMDAEADDLVSTDAGMVSMKTALNTRRSLLVSQMANLTPNHPLYKQDQEELQHINASLQKMTDDLRTTAAAHIQQKLKNDLERTSGVESKLNARLAQLTAAAGSAGPRLQRLNELSTDIDRLQRRFAIVDEQFRNLNLENQAPGGVYIANAATPPVNAEHDLVYRNAAVILLAGLLLGLGTALIAQNLDKRIYIATDVERVLGFAPMAQLPDFYEVGTGVAEEYLLRLAAALEHAYQDGALKSCIFTGVAPGAGATTVANRVNSMLEAMGRETVLVDASGTPGAAASGQPGVDASTDLMASPRGSRSTALLQQMTEQAGEDAIVLTDTAPLLVSGETEYLARFVDSAIVVIESGVTTKAQLRDVAHTLQKLHVSAVGFVLNRISMERANPAFRESVRAVERHIYAQTRAVVGEPAAEMHPKPGKKGKKARRERAPQSEPVDQDDTDRDAEIHRVAAREQAANAKVEPVAHAVHAAPPQQASISQAEAVPEFSAMRNPHGMPNHPFTPEGSDGQPVQSAQRPNSFVRESSAPPVEAPVQPPVGAPLRGRPLGRTARPAAPESVAPVVPPPAYTAPQYSAAPPIEAVREPARVYARPGTAFSSHPPTLAELQPAPAPQQTQVGVSESAADSAELAVQTAASAPEGDVPAIPYSAASRLGGLRNLLVSLGVKTLNKEGESREQEPAPEVRVERVAERPVYAEPYRPATAANAEPMDSVSVSAQPEFLPPRPMVETTEPEKETRPAAAPRPARWDSDEVTTLPSKRGQYRKRR